MTVYFHCFFVVLRCIKPNGPNMTLIKAARFVRKAQSVVKKRSTFDEILSSLCTRVAAIRQ